MKKTKIIIFTLLFCGLTLNAEAQFLKDLKKQIIEKSKDVIINKTTDKVSDQVSKSMDNILGADLESLMEPIGRIKDIESLPESYKFDYIYSLKMSSTEAEIPIDYYLSSSKSYMGVEMKMENSITMIYDNTNNALVTFIGDKAIATELPKVDLGEIEEADNNEYKISNLPNKTFLGYNCLGRLIENDEHKMKIYVAPNTDISFADIFKNNFAKMPSQLKLTSKNDMDGILMYAEIIEKTKKRIYNNT